MKENLLFKFFTLLPIIRHVFCMSLFCNTVHNKEPLPSQ